MTRKQAAEILGVLPDVTENELKKRYHALMQLTHPDMAERHDYPYEVHEINAAYDFLQKYLYDDDKSKKIKAESRIHWNAPINPNAYTARPIYQYYEDNDGIRIGVVTVDSGKYMWIIDEEFSLFLRSLYETAKQIIAEDDEKKNVHRTDDMSLMADIAYLLAGQFFGTRTALGLMKKEDKNIFFTKAMLEYESGIKLPKEGSALIPGKIKNHRLYVKDDKGNELGYLTFKDDRLLFGIIPLFERRAVQLKMTTCASKRGAKSVDVDMWIKLIEENVASLDSINLRIRQLLDEDKCVLGR